MKIRFQFGLLILAAGIFPAGSLSNSSSAAAASLPVPQSQIVDCESRDQQRNTCSVPIGGNVRISRQISLTQCVEGRNWSWNSNGITVWGGCRAEFTFDPSANGNSGNRRGGWNRGGSRNFQTIRCESSNYHRQDCAANVGGSVHIVRQISDRKCEQGRNWGWTHTGIWVDNGCAAEFEFREAGSATIPGGSSGLTRVTCESPNNQVRECNVGGVVSSIRVAQQLSSATCNEGSSWGVRPNRQAIWVRNGCRAVFEVTVR